MALQHYNITNLLLSASITGSNVYVSGGYAARESDIYGNRNIVLTQSSDRVADCINVGYQIYLSGTNLTGSVVLQVSNNNAGWVNYLSQSFNTGSTSIDFGLQAVPIAYERARFAWIASSTAATGTFCVHGNYRAQKA